MKQTTACLLSKLKKLDTQGGREGLLPQNLSDDLLEGITSLNRINQQQTELTKDEHTVFLYLVICLANLNHQDIVEIAVSDVYNRMIMLKCRYAIEQLRRETPDSCRFDPVLTVENIFDANNNLIFNPPKGYGLPE